MKGLRMTGIVSKVVCSLCARCTIPDSTAMTGQGRRDIFQWIYLYLLCLHFSEVTGQEESRPELETKYGVLVGRQIRVKESAQTVFAYLGIPFAEPPVGVLRFSAPQSPRAWQGLRDATAFPPLCLQNMNHTKRMWDFYAGRYPPLRTSEDCLYLNVYTPVKPGQPHQLPVMVWIHGGGFLMGGASLYDGSSLAAFGDVVIVIIQYRLGIPGFLSTGDGQAPGNMGLLDQVCALRWVQDTIHSFGGDPGSVTIFGESAGGNSVFLHMLSPLSSGLFHRAIIQSGVPLIPLIITSDPKSAAQLLAQKAGCTIGDSADIMQCFRKRTPQEIEAATPWLGDMVLILSLDGEFVPKDIEERIQRKTFKNVPWITGINNHEFGWMLPHMALFPGWDLGITRQMMTMTLAFMLQKGGLSGNAQEILVDEYFGKTENPGTIRDALLDLIGDLIFVFPAIKGARDHRDAGFTTYFYEFQQRPSMYGDNRPDFVKADHFDEIGFVFGAPFWTEDIVMLDRTSEAERHLSKTMMKYWTNFAKTGNPNGEGLLEWPVFNEGEKYLQLNLTIKLGTMAERRRLTFWTEQFPKKLHSQSNLSRRSDL
ncbi:hypothetical protein MATL_G00096960 [Megalops atlanticus]|uniref:Carboxylic ester hydrolase n=1 Tax=Megalops atlanticus TaxID=7932 RepID=A0A9D3Q6I9_MEGAT|nr:hypothetical protein MATL_G00096960 [Megalops atlanticus]